MKIVAINSSPRHKGNTQKLIDTCFEPLIDKGHQCQTINIGGERLYGCQACNACIGKTHCIKIDDPMNSWLDIVRDADAIILGSPTYYANITTEMKAFIDRAGRVLGSNGVLLRKVGAPIVVCRRGGAMQTYNSLMAFFGIHSMVVPMSSYWNLGIGREIGEVVNDAEGLKTMINLGNNMAWLLDKIHA